MGLLSAESKDQPLVLEILNSSLTLNLKAEVTFKDNFTLK